tara:strand:+ start:121 stop:294 length:174 start_codon:yes stop_codon:yes gene_type:complete
MKFLEADGIKATLVVLLKSMEWSGCGTAGRDIFDEVIVYPSKSCRAGTSRSIADHDR